MAQHFSLTTGKLERCKAQTPASCPLSRELEELSGTQVNSELLHGAGAQAYVESLLNSQPAPLKKSHYSPLLYKRKGEVTKEERMEENKRARALYTDVFKDQNASVLPMTRPEDRAFGAYKWSGYGWMNRYLRDPSSVTQESLGMGEKLSMVDDLNGLIKRQPPLEKDITVYRAGGSPELHGLPPLIDAANPQRVKLSGFISTSLSAGIFSQFTKPTRLAITVPKGTSVLPMEGYKVGGASLQQEWEVLLPHGTNLLITKKEERDGITYLYGSVVTDSNS